MANEFIIKNGYVSKGDSQVSGSLNVGTTATEHKLTITGKTYPTIELLANQTYQGIITSTTSTATGANSNGLIFRPGNNTAANGGGGNLTLSGGNSTDSSGLTGGDVRIIGGYSGNSSRNIGEVFISGSLIDLRGPVTGSFTGSYTGSFVGDGSALTLSVDLTSDVTGVLPSANMDSDTAHLSGTQTFSGTKLFSAGLTITGNNYIQFLGTSGGGGEGIKFLDTADGNREVLHFPGNDLVVLSNRSSNGIIEIRSNNSTAGSGGETLSARFTATGSFVSRSLEVDGSGSGIFSVEGSVGTLFTVDDGLDDVIFAANNVSGTPVISANADNTVKLGKLGGFGIVISGSTPAPDDAQAKIIITGSMHTSGSLGVGMAANSTIGRIDAKNDVVAFSTSDERLKDNITPIQDALTKVSQVQGIKFDWIPKEGVHGNEGHDVGVIAQEIEKVLPEVVTTRENGYKAVKYEKIIPLLVEAIKELQEEIKELKKDK